MIGVVETPEALRLARESGLDLVEIVADSTPPVCRIMDFGKFKYEQSKKRKANKAKSKQAELKEVRLGRSMKIDEHDIEIRLRQARRFLMDGHKVQIVQNFRGREMQHRERGHERMQGIVEQLSDVGKLEMPPRLNGRRLTMMLAPDRAKIEQIKRREASAREKAARDAGTTGSDGSAGSTDAEAKEAADESHEPVVETPASERETSSSRAG